MSPLKRLAVYSIVLAGSAAAGVWGGEKLYATAHPLNSRYLEYRADGTVWALWPDGRFIEVVPK
jgi:hypothetical protein